MGSRATTTDVFNAIAKPRRRQIVELLARRGALAAGTLVVALGLPQPAVSKHLGVLRKVGVVAVITEHHRPRETSPRDEELAAIDNRFSSFFQFSQQPQQAVENGPRMRRTTRNIKNQRERLCPRRCEPPDGRGRVHRQSRRRRQR